MTEIKNIAIELAEGWNVASSHPLLFIIIAALIAYLSMRITFLVCHKDRIENHKKHLDILDSQKELLELKLKFLQEEADRYKSEISKAKDISEKAVPIVFGNDAIKSAFESISKPENSHVEINPTIQPGKDKFIAFGVLRDVGMATIYFVRPDSVIVTGTSSAISVREEIESKNHK